LCFKGDDTAVFSDLFNRVSLQMINRFYDKGVKLVIIFYLSP